MGADMWRFGLGLILGLFLGAATASVAAILAGDDGYLLDWTVTRDGEEICSAPFVWISTQEIECD
jgi:hypothetical protein